MKLPFGSLFVICALVTGTPAMAQFTILHSFSGSASDGDGARGSLIQSGSTLYGMTVAGGSSGVGTIFKIGTDGSGFGLLHSFTGAATDGANPYDSLIQSGATLYGVTSGGGSRGYGTIFKIGTDGTGFSLLHSFTSGTDGDSPIGSLIQSGSTLYGMTSGGGSNLGGTIFQIGTDGTGYSTLHSFSLFDLNNGTEPTGSMLQSGSTLYGLTRGGGTNNRGTIFRVGTDGTNFSTIHSFTGSPAGPSSDGDSPCGSLIQSGSTLYGMTSGGGSSTDGTIYKIGTDGTGFSLLHSFDVGAYDGSTYDGGGPNGSLIRSGSTLYGMTTFGGLYNAGTIFQIATDGTGYRQLHYFIGGDIGGDLPDGSVVQLGSTLYGMTSNGGIYPVGGTIFSLAVPEPGSAALLASGLLIWLYGSGLLWPGLPSRHRGLVRNLSAHGRAVVRLH